VVAPDEVVLDDIRVVVALVAVLLVCHTPFLDYQPFFVVQLLQNLR
jgi:hypothetical protein